jgi:predicted dehydrogenase
MGIRVGLIGCGRQAPKHISGFSAWGDVDVVVADILPERAEACAAELDVRAARAVDDIFADREIAAVSICTPPASHGALIRRAIASGKHFFCEKPLTGELAESRALEVEAGRAGLIGMVGYIYRFAPSFELAGRLLGGAGEAEPARALGEIGSARFRLGGPGSHAAWQHRREAGGGAINEMLVHMMDLVIWLFGPLRDARILASDVRWPVRMINARPVEADAEDWVVASASTASGVEVLIEADLTTPTFVQHAEIHGANGTFMGSIQPDMPTFVHCLEARGEFRAGKTACNFGARNLFEPQMKHFLDGVTGAAALERGTLRQSVELMEAVEMLRAGAPGGLGRRLRTG